MILNILVNECWKCKNDYLIAYLADDSIPVGPSYFTERQIDIARENGVRIETVHSKTMDEDYDACICPHCEAFLGEFFYHDFTYIDGEVQYKLNENDEIIEKIVNKDIFLKEHNGYDPEVEKRKLEDETKNIQKDISRLKRNRYFSEYNCVRVKFENGKNYPYNCPFDIDVGDTVYVEGKMQGIKGKVVKITGKWKPFRNMQEIIKVDKGVIEDADS